MAISCAVGCSLSPTVAEALAGVEATGDTAEVALRLADRVDREGVTPSLVRELRYALLALGVTELAPYNALMAVTKAQIDASDESLPTLAAQLREQEQTVRRLGAEPVNAPAARAVREAVDALVAGWERAWAEHVAGIPTDWETHRVGSLELWAEINGAGGESAWPEECERAGLAFAAYWRGRVRARRGGSYVWAEVVECERLDPCGRPLRGAKFR